MSRTQEYTQEKAPLPGGFTTIQEILKDEKRDKKGQKLIGKKVNIIAFISDFQKPTRTNGTDFKCTLELLDHSIASQSLGIKFVIFWPEESMPTISGAGDVILIRQAKVSMWSGSVCLLTAWETVFHIIPSSEIPESVSDAASAPWRGHAFKKGVNPAAPSVSETAYVVWAKSQSVEIALPTTQEFQEKVLQSVNVKDKFCLMKDAKTNSFCDIIGEVIKMHDPGFDKLTIHLSDYTANSMFYNHVWTEGHEETEEKDGDEYGYVKPKKKVTGDWPGPFGKLCIQLTLWDGHARRMRESGIKQGDWIHLTNIQIKTGHMGGLLEGFLRGDSNGFGGKIQVRKMETSDNGDNFRWKEAVRRKQQWWEKFNAQKQAILDEASGLPSKRKASDEAPSKFNSKQRRKERRAAAEKKAAILEAKAAEDLDLNKNIKCAFPDKPIVSVKEILKPELFLRIENGQEFVSPFTLRKYRANVRVVDYYPHRIVDFAVGRRASEYDMLSDYSGGEDTDPEEEMRIFRSGRGFAKKVWEWRFEILVEDASSSGKERLWLSIGNQAAQGLLGLEDNASNLRGDPALVNALKEQLFKLWGDLEEQKSAILKNQASEPEKLLPPSSFDTTPSSTQVRPGAQPDVDSDIESEDLGYSSRKSRPKSTTLKERAVESTMISEDCGRVGSQCSATLKPNNKAFTCCIRQYGVLVDEQDPYKANAGKGKRWQRKFGLFGTTII